MSRHPSTCGGILTEESQSDLLDLGIFQVKRRNIETDQTKTTVPADLERRALPEIGHAAGKRPCINNEGVVRAIVSAVIGESGGLFPGNLRPPNCTDGNEPKSQKIKGRKFH